VGLSGEKRKSFVMKILIYHIGLYDLTTSLAITKSVVCFAFFSNAFLKYEEIFSKVRNVVSDVNYDITANFFTYKRYHIMS
jgi:hypothetical protein